VESFAEGIPGCIVAPMGKYIECDIAIIFGAVKDSYKPTWPKREIMEKHKGKRLIMIESGFVKRGEYYQIGWGGFAGNADFNNHGCPEKRWKKTKVKIKPWKKKGDLWVVMGQVPWDTQVQDVDHVGWCQETIEKLEAQGKKAVFRPHPRITDHQSYGVDSKYIDSRPLDEVLEEAAAVVTWNSTSALDSILQGVPVVACHRSSICYNIGVNSIEKTLIYPDRRQFLNNLGYSMWTIKEMKAGLPWRHLNRKR